MGMLSLENVAVWYGDLQVIFGVSIEVQPKSMVGLVGPNGAGKTTLLKAISGLADSVQGKIGFDGEEITHLAPHKIASRGISHAPEGKRLFQSLSVESNLRLGAFDKRARSREYENFKMVFELFPVLRERRRQRAGTLSGGEQQMLAIGRALMSDPKLLMLDEPSLGLAPLVADSVFRTIRQINQRDVAILLVEQNVQRCLELTGTAYVMEEGKIALSGESGNLLRDRRLISTYLGVARD